VHCGKIPSTSVRLEHGASALHEVLVLHEDAVELPAVLHDDNRGYVGPMRRVFVAHSADGNA
jgi:hypothetical protein